MRSSDGSSDVCSSDLPTTQRQYPMGGRVGERAGAEFRIRGSGGGRDRIGGARAIAAVGFGVEQRAVGGAVELLPVGFGQQRPDAAAAAGGDGRVERHPFGGEPREDMMGRGAGAGVADDREFLAADAGEDRKSTRLNSSH